MTALSAEQEAMVALFQRHVDAELAGDLDTTMATMTDDPHLNHVASMAPSMDETKISRPPER
jgi:carboxymethylenebutenolidase